MLQHYITIAVTVFFCLDLCAYVRLWVYTQCVCCFHSTQSSIKASSYSKTTGSGLKHSLDMDTFSPTLQLVTNDERQKLAKK